MPTFVSNLPVHVLVVHAVVVLVPLAVLGSIAVVLWPAARRRYGGLVIVVTAVATAFIPIATSTGEGLEHSLPPTALISVHTHLGDQLLPYVAGMLVLVTAFVALHQRGRSLARREGPGTTTAGAGLTGRLRLAAGMIAALTVVLAVVSAVQVYRIGDAGARAVWSNTQYVTSTHGQPPPDGNHG
jgi:uncharacterized membrane protein